jgi:hypothetical protein
LVQILAAIQKTQKILPHLFSLQRFIPVIPDEAADKVASLREQTHQHHEAVIDNDTDKLVIQGGPNFSPVLF